MIDNDMKHSEDTPSARLDGDTPNLRLFALLEAVAQKSQPFTLQTMVEETGLPKPTMHRMLAQLESAGILQSRLAHHGQPHPSEARRFMALL